MLKLNASGVAHHFVLALAIVGIISAFAFQAVSGHAQLPEGESATSKAAPSVKKSASSCQSGPVLKVGSSGACVKLLQSKLGISADGRFGPGTKARVIAFQKNSGLTADGVVGPATWAKILRTSATSVRNTPTKTPVATNNTKQPTRSKHSYSCIVNYSFEPAGPSKFGGYFASVTYKNKGTSTIFASANIYSSYLGKDANNNYKYRSVSNYPQFLSTTTLSPGQTYTSPVIPIGLDGSLIIAGPKSNHPAFTLKIRGALADLNTNKLINSYSCSKVVRIPAVTNKL